jgi:hypothetical protein
VADGPALWLLGNDSQVFFNLRQQPEQDLQGLFTRHRHEKKQPDAGLDNIAESMTTIDGILKRA